MKALKVIAIIVVLLVLVVIGVGVYVVYNTNRLVDAGIETVGTRYLGAPVVVDAVDVSLSEGRATLTGLEIGNPPGYEGDYAMRLATVSVTLDPVASNAQHLALKRVAIDGAELAAVLNGPRDTNFQALIDNLDKADGGTSDGGAGASTMKLTIEALDFTGAQTSIAAPLVGKQANARIPDIHLKDVGSGGATVAEVLRQILTPIARSVLQEAAEQQLGEGTLRGKVDEAMERLRALGHPE